MKKQPSMKLSPRKIMPMKDFPKIKLPPNWGKIADWRKISDGEVFGEDIPLHYDQYEKDFAQFPQIKGKMNRVKIFDWYDMVVAVQVGVFLGFVSSAIIALSYL